MEPPGELLEGEALVPIRRLSSLGLLSPAWNRNVTLEVEQLSRIEVFGMKTNTAG